jgi:hypothetical protein
LNGQCAFIFSIHTLTVGFFWLTPCFVEKMTFTTPLLDCTADVLMLMLKIFADTADQQHQYYASFGDQHK